jgi:hypothetical protein
MAHASFVLCGVLVMIAVQSAPANANARLRCSASVASCLIGDVAVGFRMSFRVEIGQPHIDPKGHQGAAERAVATARIERNSWQFEA